jgi:hypothetical protein
MWSPETCSSSSGDEAVVISDDDGNDLVDDLALVNAAMASPPLPHGHGGITKSAQANLKGQLSNRHISA